MFNTRIKKALWTFVLLILIAVVVVGDKVNGFLTQPINSGYESIQQATAEKQVVEIAPGSSAYKVAYELNRLALLANPRWFVWYVQYHEMHSQIKAGEMWIDPNWTVAQLAEALIKGDTVSYSVTLVAGHDFKLTLNQLQQAEKLEQGVSASDFSSVLSRLQKPENAKVNVDPVLYPYAQMEGWFLPETYHYKKGDSDVEILSRAHTELLKVLGQAWQNRQKNLPLKSPYEALILASIVEKETGIAHERPLIAGVFMNRLRKKMRLQTDPTVIYGIGQSYDGNIRKRDLRQKTVYNTYRINGLPPTPIAMPSRAAIEAVCQPQSTKALYFVAKGGGEHYFSNTLQEHNRAVRKYLLKR